MIVISKVSTKRLIKDHKYEVDYIYNDNTSRNWIEGRLGVKNLGQFRVYNFKTIDGKEIPKIRIDRKVKEEHISINNCIEGDLVICLSNGYTTFTRDCMYKINKIQISEIISYGRKFNVIKVKFEGNNNWIKSTYNFRPLSDQELREIHLESLLEDKEPNIIIGKQRKIELVQDKNKELIKEIANSILDRNRHHLSVLEWAIEKTGKKLKLEKSDFDELLDMKFSDILKLID